MSPASKKTTQFKAIVLSGDQTGRSIGFPTVNLEPDIFPSDFQQGIYACMVTHKNENKSKSYMGALFYGPRLVKNEQQNVLEIHILDFDQNIYDHEIFFEIHDYIRDIKNFDTLEDLKAEIARDIKKIRQLLGAKFATQ